MEARISFSQDKAVYHGQRMKVAVVLVNGAKFNLAVSDTSRCANSQEAAARTLKNLAKRAGFEDFEIDNDEDVKLNVHCRELMGMKKPKPEPTE
jgi:hypothetical protein